MKRLLLCLLLFGSGTLPLISPAHAAEKEAGVSHVVLMWLKEPGNRQAIETITRVSYSFAGIPGVLSVKVGESVTSERNIVDDSFDLGIILSFPDKAAMQHYLTHPIHKKAIHDIIQPLVKKIIVYNING